MQSHLFVVLGMSTLKRETKTTALRYDYDSGRGASMRHLGMRERSKEPGKQVACLDHGYHKHLEHLVTRGMEMAWIEME